MVGDIAGEAERLLGVVENLLLLTKLESGIHPDPEPQVLAHVVRLSSTRSSAGTPSRDIRLTDEPRHLIVDADRPYLDLILENLLGNALKYSPAGAPIEVVVRATETEAQVLVLDRGIGLTDADLDRLFTAFYRTEAARGRRRGWASGSPPASASSRALAAGSGQSRARAAASEFGFALPLADGARRPGSSGALPPPLRGSFAALAWASRICLNTLPMPGRIRSRAAACASRSRRRMRAASRVSSVVRSSRLGRRPWPDRRARGRPRQRPRVGFAHARARPRRRTTPSSASAPAPTGRATAGSRSSSSSSGWLLLDAEQTDDLGLPLARGPFADARRRARRRSAGAHRPGAHLGPRAPRRRQAREGGVEGDREGRRRGGQPAKGGAEPSAAPDRRARRRRVPGATPSSSARSGPSMATPSGPSGRTPGSARSATTTGASPGSRGATPASCWSRRRAAGSSARRSAPGTAGAAGSTTSRSRRATAGRGSRRASSSRSRPACASLGCPKVNVMVRDESDGGARALAEPRLRAGRRRGQLGKELRMTKHAHRSATAVASASAYLAEHPDEARYRDGYARARGWRWPPRRGRRARRRGSAPTCPRAIGGGALGAVAGLVLPRRGRGLRRVADRRSGPPPGHRPAAGRPRGHRRQRVGRSRHPRPRRGDPGRGRCRFAWSVTRSSSGR